MENLQMAEVDIKGNQAIQRVSILLQLGIGDVIQIPNLQGTT